MLKVEGVERTEEVMMRATVVMAVKMARMAGIVEMVMQMPTGLMILTDNGILMVMATGRLVVQGPELVPIQTIATVTDTGRTIQMANGMKMATVTDRLVDLTVLAKTAMRTDIGQLIPMDSGIPMGTDMVRLAAQEAVAARIPMIAMEMDTGPATQMVNTTKTAMDVAVPQETVVIMATTAPLVR